MNDVMRILTICLALGATVALAQVTNSPKQGRSSPASEQSRAGKDSRGQQVFEQNCRRCHNEPEGFSPNVSGTITMHMRVRAGLNDDDYKDLLKFFNP